MVSWGEQMAADIQANLDKTAQDTTSTKLAEITKPKVVEPVVPVSTVKPVTTATTATTQPLQPVNQPTLADFIAEAQKLSTQKTDAAKQELALSTGDVAQEFARQLYGQNVGSQSGVGKELANRAIQDQAKRLEPIFTEEAAKIGEQELKYKYEDSLKTQERRENLFQGVLDGTVDKSALTPEDWAAVGITNPDAVNTYMQIDLNAAMVADGLDPKNPEHVAEYKTGLRNAKTNQLKEQIVSNYAAVNDGQIPTIDQINMLLYIFGEGSGLLTAAEENAMINKYNADQWEKTMKKAEAMNPPDDGSVLCTELYKQGLLSEEVFNSDMLIGKYYRKHDPEVMIGYHSWGKPLAKLMSRSKLVTYILKPFITMWANEMHYLVTGKGKTSLIARTFQDIGITLCRSIGKQRRVVAW